MGNTEIIDLQPAFDRYTFEHLVLWHGTEVFARFFFPKNDPKKMSQIEEWLQDSGRLFCISYLPVSPFAIATLCIIALILVKISIHIEGISDVTLNVICNIICLFILAIATYFTLTISPSKLLEVFENLRDYNLIDYHVEPYECQIAVYKDGRFKKQTGYVGITDDGRVIWLSRELRFVELGIGYNIELNQNFMRQEILKVYRKKFGAKQQTDETNVVVRL